MADTRSSTVYSASPFATTENLRERVVESVLARAGFNHTGLNAHLRERLTSSDISAGALVTDPIIEGAASYESCNETLSDLAGSLLSIEVVSALTRGEDGDDYRFDPEMRPYLHQLKSWNHLSASDPRSVLVTSGTGSGKTECFLVPLLNDLAKEAADAVGRLSGVRAIMLYPLNALIASQEERLRRWTIPFEGRIRFGLYNGMTPEDLRGHDRKAEAIRHPEQAIDRKAIRADPPQILVTNVTMLEYLTIRREDRPLVENSKGKLRWIIIDEAHSYVGSQSAEIALLLRRVLQTFDVNARDVRFVATSATIGGSGEESHNALRRFLADLAGIEESQVHVVQGARAPVELPSPRPQLGLDPMDLKDPAILASNPAIQAFVRAAEAGPISLSTAHRLLTPAGLTTVSTIEAIAADSGESPLLPLRIHQFIRAVPGVWSCLNPACNGTKPQDWPHGSLHLKRTDQCPSCNSPVFEIVGCRECGEPYLAVFDRGGILAPFATAPEVDEFSTAIEREALDTGGDEDEEEEIAPAHPSFRRLVGVRALASMTTIAIEATTGAILERRDSIGSAVVPLTPFDWDGCCPNCLAVARKGADGMIRPFRFGAPFLIGNSVPIVLGGVKPMDQLNGLLPAEGRRLLSFTDSRQGTARFAANIETNAERSYVRSYIYHLVQKSMQLDPDVAEDIATRRAEVEAIEQAAKTAPALVDVARRQRAELDQLTSGAQAGVTWKDARQKLAQDPMVRNWIRAVWEDRDRRFEKDIEGFSNFLLLRELARRPRRANAIETLGLARLQFDRIEKLSASALPEALRRQGRKIEEWRDFLYVLIDTPVRSYFALNVSWDDVRWLLPRGGVRRNLVGPGENKRTKSDLMWPQARSSVGKSTPVLLLERMLHLDSSSSEDRAEINDILSEAWNALSPLFDSGGSEDALVIDKAVIAPVGAAWLCPVTRRVLTRRVFGCTPYGHREASPFAGVPPMAIQFPELPLAFPRNASEFAQLFDWLRNDAKISALRERGVWRDLHDRAVMLEPYLRAEEHSAQQPPARLRTFEREFKDGEINVLACSTTMEMGVDIGSVGAVMMTNVPPSIANYRQRVGRAGRRRQGFATSLTLARDTPLDRETFRQPEAYLKREIRPPQVKLDAPRIVQRHVNALLLAHWFAKSSGELLKIKAGAFFGYPDSVTDGPPPTSPLAEFRAWLVEPSVRAQLATPLRALTRGTALDASSTLCETTSSMFEEARTSFERQWGALRSEALAAPSEQARTSIVMQLKRLCRENLWSGVQKSAT